MAPDGRRGAHGDQHRISASHPRDGGGEGTSAGDAATLSPLLMILVSIALLSSPARARSSR
jgi:hypothetical protein